MRTARGTITMVQEQRFRLVTDQGQGLLLTLAGNARLADGDLGRLQAAQAHVVVEYSGEANLDTAVAWAVRPSAAHEAVRHPS